MKHRHGVLKLQNSSMVQQVQKIKCGAKIYQRKVLKVQITCQHGTNIYEHDTLKVQITSTTLNFIKYLYWVAS